MKLFTTTLASIGLFAGTVAAVDQTLLDFETELDSWNVVALDEFYAPAGSQVEGRLLTGGDATLGAYSVGAAEADNAAQVDFACMGELDFIGGTVHNSFVYNTNTTALPGYLCETDGCSITRDASAYDVSSMETNFDAISAAMAALSVSGTVTDSFTTYSLVDVQADTNVFLMTAEQVADATSMSLSVPEGAFTIINVSGTTVDFSAVSFLNDFERRGGMVVLNFYEATSLKISATVITGSILAPHAHVEFPSGIVRGDAVFASMSSASTVGGATTTEGTGSFELDAFDSTNTGDADPTGDVYCPFSVTRGAYGSTDDGTITYDGTILLESGLSDDDVHVQFVWTVEDIGSGTLVDAGAVSTSVTGLTCEDTPTVSLTCTDLDGNTNTGGPYTVTALDFDTDGCTDDDSIESCNLEPNMHYDYTLGGCVCDDLANQLMNDGAMCTTSCRDSVCSGRGDCVPDGLNTQTECVCDDYNTWDGPQCDIDVATACNGNGMLNADDSTCTCWDDTMFTGTDCGTDADTACNGRGNFAAGDGVCSCYNGYEWTGSDCDTASAYAAGVGCVGGVWDTDAQTCSCSNDADTFYFHGDTCDSCLDLCNGRGLCSGEDGASCDCFDARWGGTFCDEYTEGSANGDTFCFHSQDDCATCDDGWSGEFCDSFTPCYHGSWVDGSCVCDDAAWSGDDCNTYTLIPSADDGTDIFDGCVNGDDSSGTCLCEDKWFGDDCNTYWCTNGIKSDADDDGEYDTCTCIPGFTSDNEDDELYCELNCRAECNWQGTICGDVAGTCECDADWSGETCDTYTTINGNTFDIAGGALGMVSGGTAEITLDIDSGNAGSVVDGDIVLGDVSLDIVGEGDSRRLDDVEYTITVAFASEPANEPTIVDNVGDVADCVSTEYDEENRVLTAVVCSSGSYSLGSIQTASAADDDDSSNEESSSSSSDDFPVGMVGAAAGVGVIVGVAAVSRRRRRQKILDGSNARQIAVVPTTVTAAP